MKEMIKVLAGIKCRMYGEMTKKEIRAIDNIIAVLEKVDDLADCYDVLERDSGNEEGN